MNSHSAVPGLNRDAVYELTRKVPEYWEQQKIADSLAILDSRIKLNQRMNITLEAVGQALFKRWFVDFEFPNPEGKPYRTTGGQMVYNKNLEKEIPIGWRDDLLGNHTTIKGRIGWKGLQVAEYTPEGPFIVGGLQFLNGRVNWNECAHITNQRYEESPEIMLKQGDILMTKDGTIGKLAYIHQIDANATVASHIHVIRNSSKIINQMYLWYYFKSNIFRNLVNGKISGSVVPALLQKDINNLWVVLPPPDIVKKFELIALSIENKIDNNIRESDTLKKIRDSLLPELMSGKIRVPVNGNLEAKCDV